MAAMASWVPAHTHTGNHGFYVGACKNPPEMRKGRTEFAEQGFVGEGPIDDEKCCRLKTHDRARKQDSRFTSLGKDRG